MFGGKLAYAVKGTPIEPFARNVLRRWRKTIQEDRVESVNGINVNIPYIRGITNYQSEPWMSELLAKTLRRRPGSFLDVGVNTGQTLIKLKSIDPDRDYVGLEPNPYCVFYTRELIKINDFRNCTLVPVGLFTEDTVLVLDLYSESPADSAASIISDFRPTGEIADRMLAPVFRFTSLERAIGLRSYGIVKIDVEGAELEVFGTLSDMIRKDRPIIHIEILPVYSADNIKRRSRQSDLEKIIRELDYALLRVGVSGWGTLTGLTALDTIEVHSDLNLCEYVVAPREIADDLARA